MLLCGWLPSAVFAGCIVNPDPEMRHIQRLIATDATQALKQLQERMNAVRQEPGATPGRAEQLASLYAVEAEAYGILERSAEARNSAAEGRKLATLPNDPVRLELLSAYAENVYDEAGIAAAAADIEAARSAQKSDTQAAICLLITRGLLEHRENRADLAIVTLTQAYHASAAPSMMEPHVLSAEVLSAVMRVMGDYQQALALNQEAVDWHASRGETLSLSVARFMRGLILKLMHSYGRALRDACAGRRSAAQLSQRLLRSSRVCAALRGVERYGSPPAGGCVARALRNGSADRTKCVAAEGTHRFAGIVGTPDAAIALERGRRGDGRMRDCAADLFSNRQRSVPATARHPGQPGWADRLAHINDCCGHATGDYVLKEFARAGGEALRPGDLLGRWGGEEFLLVSPGSTVPVGMAALERLRTLIYRIHLPPSGVGLRVSLSAGIAAFDASVNSLDELIARADKALYAAKSAGRDRVSIADATQITGAHGARRTQRI